MNLQINNLVRRITPTLTPINSVNPIPISEPVLTEEEVRMGFQQLFPGVSTEGLTRMQMLMAMGRKNLRGI